MRSPFKFLRIAGLIAAPALAAGCAPEATTHFGHASQPLDEAAPTVLYEFVEYAPPVSKDAPPREALSLCANRCITDSHAAYGACTAEAYTTAQIKACRASVHDQVTACVQSGCTAEGPTPADSCTLGCTAEARSVSASCLDDADHCLTESNDVYSTCYAAECQARTPRRLSNTVVHAIRVSHDEGPTAEESATHESACTTACQGHDLAVYLECVSDRPDDQASCRAAIGQDRKSVV